LTKSKSCFSAEDWAEATVKQIIESRKIGSFIPFRLYVIAFGGMPSGD
jgi:hypothetical protein